MNKKDNKFRLLNFSGWILMVHLFSAGGKKIGVAIIVMIVTLGFAVVVFAGGLLLMKVRLIY